MPCYSGIVQSVEQRTVNPYVTGSSPVARATVYPRFLGFFFTFTAATRSGIKGTQMSYFYNKVHICTRKKNTQKNASTPSTQRV